MLKIPLLYLTSLVKSFFKSPFMQRLAYRHPHTSAFLKARFSSGYFFGLPFTIFLVVAIINIFFLSTLAEYIVNADEVKSFDARFSNAFYRNRSLELSQAFYYFTQLGTIYGVVAVTILAAIYFAIKKRFYHLIALLVSTLGSGLSMQLLKNYFNRERPLNIGYYPTMDAYSFPSGHAAAAVALQGLLIYFLISSVRSRRTRFWGSVIGIIYILLIGFSRIYLGVHFLTDVTAGYILGLLWLLFSVVVMEFMAVRKLKRLNRQKVATDQMDITENTL